jgi:hypothetical protein
MEEDLVSVLKKIASPWSAEFVTVAHLVPQSQSKFKIPSGSVTINGTQKCHQSPEQLSFL